MIKTSGNSLTSEADKIMFNEIAPIITKLFSSITSELLIMPQHWEDKDGTKQKIYNMVSDKCIDFLTSYIKGTAKIQYELLCKPPVMTIAP